MAHIVLLGDSIFDNKSYVGAEGKDVVTHLSKIIQNDWQATLRAIDGSTTEGIRKQLLETPDEATHLVLSVGGNDAILQSDILEMKAGSSADVLSKIADIQSEFEFRYQDCLAALRERNLLSAVCTIYYPRFPDVAIQRLAITALAAFNDVIIRQAVLSGLPLLDLRLICNEDSDYANPIEPSDTGGKKIATKILELIQTHDFSRRRTEIFY